MAEPKKFDWEKYTSELYELTDPNAIIEKLEYGYNTYPSPFSIPITISPNLQLNSYPITIYAPNYGSNTPLHKREFLDILTIKNDLRAVCDSKLITYKWIKRKRKDLRKETENKNTLTKDEPQQNTENIDSKSSMQTVYLLIKMKFLEHLRSMGLSDTQAYKVMGTLTKIEWGLIRRYYSGYSNGKDFPNKPNNNNPDNENTRVWLTNLLNEYKINITE